MTNQRQKRLHGCLGGKAGREMASRALDSIDVVVQMMGQLSTKEDVQVTNVSFVVKDSEAKRSVRALHSAFFLNSSAATSSSNEKRKVDDDHPEAPRSVRPLQMAGTNPCVVREVGECSSGAPNVLNENEPSYHRVKEVNNGALNKINHRMFNDDELPVPANYDLQWFSGDNGFGYLPPAAGYPLGAGQQTLAPYLPLPAGYPLGAGQQIFSYQLPAAGHLPGTGNHPYPCLAMGYQTSAEGDNGPGIGGGDGGGCSAGLAVRAPDGDDCPLFNEDDHRYLDGDHGNDWFASLSPL